MCVDNGSATSLRSKKLQLQCSVKPYHWLATDVGASNLKSGIHWHQLHDPARVSNPV